jgi:hypothetical protein
MNQLSPHPRLPTHNLPDPCLVVEEEPQGDEARTVGDLGAYHGADWEGSGEDTLESGTPISASSGTSVIDLPAVSDPPAI